MSRIQGFLIKNFRGIDQLKHIFKDERFIVLIGRGDSCKSTILSALQYALSPSWNLSFSDLDFHNQNTSEPIEIQVWVNELPEELLKESKYGLYVENSFEETNRDKLSVVIKLIVNEDLEPKWTVVPRNDEVEEKHISAADRALIGVNFIGDYTDTQFAYNRQSPIYALTKNGLQKGHDLEKVKVQLLRSMSSKVDNEHLEPFNGPLLNLKYKAISLGLSIDELCANIDIKENPYTGNSIALHHNNLPYRLQGKGSKRLMSIAIQSELTKEGGIMLVDEIEQGLEPDRVRTLVNILQSPENGQIFITTHNDNVVRECKGNNLFVVSKGSHHLSRISTDLKNCCRYNPDVLFTPKVICCEGDTEEGILRVIDHWLYSTQHISFSTFGVSVANVGGGANMFLYSAWLRELGFDTCVFADNDIKDKERPSKERCESMNIPLFLCQEGFCTERQVFQDLPWKGIIELLKCPQIDFPHKYTIMTKELEMSLSRDLSEDTQNNIRLEQAGKAIQFKWFKHIPGGKFLGSVITSNFNKMADDAPLKLCINSLLSWSMGK